jgi:hypothetical protein
MFHPSYPCVDHRLDEPSKTRQLILLLLNWLTLSVIRAIPSGRTVRTVRIVTVTLPSTEGTGLPFPWPAENTENRRHKRRSIEPANVLRWCVRLNMDSWD